MSGLALRGNIVTREEVLENGLLQIEGDSIVAALSREESQNYRGTVLSFEGHFIFPGFIDLHLHGLEGYDFTEHRKEGLLEISQKLPTFGVTGFLATTLTVKLETLFTLLDEVAPLSTPPRGARILGIHLEGPHLAPERKGAHDPHLLRKPCKEEIVHLLKRGGGIVKRITIAPELEGALETIEYLAGEGILVSLGHSTADYQTAQEACQRGAKLVTHLFNGMDPLHHRRPNLLAFALESEAIYAEIIADTVHVSPEILRLAFKCKTPQKIFPVSDAIKVAGLPDGVYPYQPEEVELKNGKAELKRTGTLAGSVCLLNRALLNLKKHVGLSLPELALVGSFLPARLLGIENILGSLEKGKKADVAVVDEHFTVQATFIAGKKVYERT
jgi:N-acetylglucosamine-6-phosphate deacetylase